MQRLQSLAAPPAPQAKLPHEQPRPLVTYMARNFFSRRLLNDHDVLRYVLSRYNVTLRVTTFEVSAAPGSLEMTVKVACCATLCTVQFLHHHSFLAPARPAS